VGASSLFAAAMRAIDTITVATCCYTCDAEMADRIGCRLSLLLLLLLLIITNVSANLSVVHNRESCKTG